MNLSRTRMGVAAISCLMAAGLLAGCADATSSNTPSPTVTQSAETVTTPAVETRSFQELLLDLRAWFDNEYCPVRGTPAAQAVIAKGWRIWNELNDRAKAQGVKLAPFNPDDPARCK